MTPISSDRTAALPTDPAAATERRLLALVESELALPARSVHAGTPIAQLGDSLDWLELLMAVEEAFGIELEPAQTKSIRTVADLLRLLPPHARDDRAAGVQEAVQQSLRTMVVPRPL